MDSDTFNIDLDVYQGPFDLLLALIKKHEIDVCDIQISKITADFLQFIKNILKSQISVYKKMDYISGFLVVASTLIQIKINALLPLEKEEEDFEEEVSNDQTMTNNELIDSLIEYKMYKNAAYEIENRMEQEEHFFSRGITSEFIELKPNFLNEIDADDICSAYKDILRRQNPVIDTSHIVGANITIEQRIKYVVNLFERERGAKTYSEIIKKCKSRMEKIVTFLALLELHKIGAISLRQKNIFGEIEIKPLNIDKGDVFAKFAEQT